MALQQQMYEVGSSDPQIFTIPDAEEAQNSTLLSISIQNLDAAIPMYLGDATVSSGNYGLRLDPGQIFTADLKPREEIYGICASGQGIVVAVIRLAR
jgi:hypothetical protein